MNITNHGQFLTKPLVQTGENLPHFQPNLSDRKNPTAHVILPMPPSDNRISPVITRPPPDQHILPVKPNPNATIAEPAIARVDLSNMTPVEFKELVHSELSRERHESGGSLDVMPYWKNRYDPVFQDMASVTDGSSDQKMNMLAVIQNAIEVKNDKGQPVEMLEQTLERLKQVDGQAIPYSINLST